MATEREYDEIIAPMMADVAKKASEFGMSLVARVEWESGESGITQIGDQDISMGQRMAWFAVHSHGNIDKMLMSMQRSGIDFSQSIYLRSFARSQSAQNDKRPTKLTGS